MADIEMTSVPQAIEGARMEQEKTAITTTQHHQHHHHHHHQQHQHQQQQSELFVQETSVCSDRLFSTTAAEEASWRHQQEDKSGKASSSSYRLPDSLASCGRQQQQLSSSTLSPSWVFRACTQLYTIFKRVVISFIRSKFFLADCVCCNECIEGSGHDHRFDYNLAVMYMLRSHLLDDSAASTNGQVEPLADHGIANDQLVLVYNLELNAFSKTKLYRCDKYNRVRFHLAASLYGRSVVLLTNYNDDYTKFDRKRYSEVKICDANNTLQLCASGSFHFVYHEAQEPNAKLGSFYIVVNPELSVRRLGNKKPQPLSINSIQCQTVLSKCMSSIDTWKDKLMVSIKTSYNMIHWTPIQELGASRSAYSLADQHRINRDFRSKSMKRDCRLDDVAKIINWLREEHGVLSIIDIVLNHTANESAWIKKHTEASYNCLNSPWLRPAFLLDRILLHLTQDIEDGKWIARGLAPEVNTDQHLDLIRRLFIENYLPLLSLEDLYTCDVDKVIADLERHLRVHIYGNETGKEVQQHPAKNDHEYSPLELLQDPEYRRHKSSIDFCNALNLVLNQIQYNGDIDRWIDSALRHVRSELAKLNEAKRKEIDAMMHYAIDNVLKGARYERIDSGGPKLVKVGRKTPLATEYFTDDVNNRSTQDMAQIEKNIYDESKACFFMAHNGWVMGDDPLKNFAEQDSLVYLRRELVCWSDSIKLRYGKAKQDSPFLWSYMEEYVKQMASTFQGLRLDNCHSTPIHVAQHMLDAARRVNPDLYLIAELFTSSEDVDNIFVNKLGINSLIREAISAAIPFELGRQVYRFGGEPVGSFQADNLKTCSESNHAKKATLYMRPMVSTVAHAIFFDVTHDNETPIVKHTPYDPIASSALVAMTHAAIGSNRGLDELVPHHIHVVKEDRTYNVWDESGDGTTGVNYHSAMINGKRFLNQLHELLSTCGYSQAFVDQRDRDTIVVTRHNPITHKSIILASRTAFYPLEQGYESYLKPLTVEGKFDKILFEMSMKGEPTNFKKNEAIINGYANFFTDVAFEPVQSAMLQVEKHESSNVIRFNNFAPSSVVAFSTSLLDGQSEALRALNAILKQFDGAKSDIVSMVNQFSLIDINYVLFRVAEEERDEFGHAAYSIATGPFVYCGLAGVMTHMARIRTHNDLGHPLCANLREGDWLAQYIVARLKRRHATAKLAEWLEQAFGKLYQLPRFLVPRYFDAILCPLYTLILDRVWLLSSDFVRRGDDFTRRLALGGVALIGLQSNAPLPELEARSIPEAFDAKLLPTMSAGLPFFASGYMRCWGRDTFIALKGLTLLTGRFDEARVLILGFAAALRHGLIPNLLDGGRKARYNCRDALWWWLQAIKDYVNIVPDGHMILKDNVRRLFVQDDTPEGEQPVDEPLFKTIQTALERHFCGIDFVERNAGPAIDEHMKTEGFNVRVCVDRSTGFVMGGNQWNCGTWMDKMGSSEKAGNKGHPATPRDGAAVEIVGLCQSSLKMLAELSEKKLYPYDGVQKLDADGNTIEAWTWKEWSAKIKANFEKHFFIDEKCQDKLVNRRGIYKDTFGASKPWMDFQLRPNFLVAMCVAPELFDSSHAAQALQIVDKTLRGPLGMRTLDPSDWNYRGDYDNSNDSNDFNVAHGFNYHNGPEWLWPTGFYFMARLKFAPNRQAELERIGQLLSAHYECLTSSEWLGLPELTNSNGKTCHGSCTVQAWSHSTLLELMHLKHFLKHNTTIN